MKNNFPKVTINEFHALQSFSTCSSLGHPFLIAEGQWHVPGSGLSPPLALLFMSGLHESVLCNPGTFTAHRSSWLNMPALCDLDSHCPLLSPALVSFEKKRGCISGKETMPCLVRFLIVVSRQIRTERDTHHEGNRPTKCKVLKSVAARHIGMHHRKSLASLF